MFFVKETPTKVASLVATSLLSLAFLFAVSSTNASFAGTHSHVPDLANPDHVVAMVDDTSAAYSNFLSANLFTPVKSSYSLVSDNVSWIGSNAYDGLNQMFEQSSRAPTGVVGSIYSVLTQ